MPEKCMDYLYIEKRIRESGFIPGTRQTRLLTRFGIIGKIKSLGGIMEEKYTIDQVLDALIQADSEAIEAIAYQDRDMLRDVLQDYLTDN